MIGRMFVNMDLNYSLNIMRFVMTQEPSVKCRIKSDDKTAKVKEFPLWPMKFVVTEP